MPPTDMEFLPRGFSLSRTANRRVSTRLQSTPLPETLASSSSTGEPGLNSDAQAILSTPSTLRSVRRGPSLPATPIDGAVVVNGVVVPVPEYKGAPALDSPMAARRVKWYNKQKQIKKRKAEMIFAK